MAERGKKTTKAAPTQKLSTVEQKCEALKKAMEQIEKLITSSPNYNKQDADGLFEMDKGTVIEILDLIETTYVYDDKFYNKDRKNDIKELLCALEYCTDKSNGKIWALNQSYQSA